MTFHARSTRLYDIVWPGTEAEFTHAMLVRAMQDFGDEGLPPGVEWDLSEAIIYATALCDAGELSDSVTIEDEDFEVLL